MRVIHTKLHTKAKYSKHQHVPPVGDLGYRSNCCLGILIFILIGWCIKYDVFNGRWLSGVLHVCRVLLFFRACDRMRRDHTEGKATEGRQKQITVKQLSW